MNILGVEQFETSMNNRYIPHICHGKAPDCNGYIRKSIINRNTGCQVITTPKINEWTYIAW